MDRFARVVLRHRSRFAVLAGLVVLLCLPGLPLLNVDNDYEAFLGRDHPDLEAVHWLQERYRGGGEVLRVIYRPHDGNPISAASIAVVRDVGTELSRLDFVVEVSSFLDQPVLFATSGSVGDLPVPRKAYRSLPFAGLPAATGRPIESFVDQLESPVFAGRRIGRSGETVALQVRFKPHLEGVALERALNQLLTRVRSLSQTTANRPGGGELHLAGVSLFNAEAQRILRADVRVLVPVALAIVAAILLAVFRRPSSLLCLFAVILLSQLCALGVAGYLGTAVSVLTSSALMVIATLAVADSIYLLSSYSVFRRGGDSVDGALQRSVAFNLRPFTITTVTTIVGYSALMLSPSPAIRDMGLVVVVGVFMALLHTILLLPWLISRFDISSGWTVTKLSSTFRGLGVLCAARPSTIVSLGAILAVAAMAGIPMTKFQDTMKGWFNEGTQMRQSLDLLDREYFGNQSVVLAQQVLDRDYHAITDPRAPDSFKDLRRLSRQVAAEDSTRHLYDVFAAAATFAKTPLFLSHEVGSKAEKLRPSTLVDSSLLTPVKAGHATYVLTHVDVHGDTNAAFVANVDSLESRSREALSDREVKLGSLGLVFARLSQDNLRNLLYGSAGTFLVITLTLVFAFGSIKVGILSILPNALPILAVYGLWGYASGTLNLAAITVLTVSIGIVVDDTVHVVAKYQSLRRDGASPADAVGETLAITGVGLTVTSAILCTGFFLLALSDFALTAQKALMVGVTLVIALLFDLLVLPALLVLVSRRVTRVAPVASGR